VGVAGQWVFGEEAMGGGDIKMMAMVGAFVGWKGVLLTVFAASVFGSLVYVPLLLRHKKRHIPFGVFLAMGAAVVFVFRDTIIDWYLRFLRAGCPDGRSVRRAVRLGGERAARAHGRRPHRPGAAR